MALASGRVLRAIPVGVTPDAVAVDERRDRVFVATLGTGGAGPAVSVLDAHSGTVIHTVAVGNNPVAIVVDPRLGHAFVLADNGTSMLDERTGAVIRTVPAGPPDTAPDSHPADIVVDTRTNRVFVINATAYDTRHGGSYESVSMLDAQSGRVMRRLTVGQSPVALAVDAATSRLFVVNRNGAGPIGSSSTGHDLWSWVPQSVRQRLPWLPHTATATTGGSVTVLDTARV